MPRVNIPVLNTKNNLAVGVDLTAGAVAADAANDHKLLNNASRVVLIVITAAASSVDISFVSVADPYGREGGTTEEGPTSIAASKVMAFGPFTPALFSQKSGADLDHLQVDLATLVGTVSLVAISVP